MSQKKPIISHIVAAGTNNAIGKDNQLLWHLPQDLKFFKNTTWAMPAIMGRKTFEPVNSKPLPGRLNIIVSRQPSSIPDSSMLQFAKDMDEAIQKAAATNALEIFIAGGAQIYAQTLAQTNRIYMTRVHASFEADAYYPEWNTDEWMMKSNRDFNADEKHAYSFSIQVWDRIESI